MDSKGKSAQKVMFGKLSSETMALVGPKTSRLMSVWETVAFVSPPYLVQDLGNMEDLFAFSQRLPYII